MKKMKKFLTGTVLFWMICLCGKVSVQAEDVDVLVKMVEPASAGEEVTVSLVMTKNPGVSTIPLRVTYDAAVLSYQGETWNPALTDGNGQNMASDVNSGINVSVIRTVLYTDTLNPLVTLRFTALADFEEMPISVTMLNGDKITGDLSGTNPELSTRIVYDRTAKEEEDPKDTESTEESETPQDTEQQNSQDTTEQENNTSKNNGDLNENGDTSGAPMQLQDDSSKDKTNSKDDSSKENSKEKDTQNNTQGKSSDKKETSQTGKTDSTFKTGAIDNVLLFGTLIAAMSVICLGCMKVLKKKKY